MKGKTYATLQFCFFVILSFISTISFVTSHMLVARFECVNVCLFILLLSDYPEIFAVKTQRKPPLK